MVTEVYMDPRVVSYDYLFRLFWLGKEIARNSYHIRVPCAIFLLIFSKIFCKISLISNQRFLAPYCSRIGPYDTTLPHNLKTHEFIGIKCYKSMEI